MSPSVTMSARATRQTLVLIASLLFGSACAENPVGPEVKALESAQARWNASRPASNSYAIEQRVSCFCPTGGTTFQITVSGGAISRVINPQTGSDVVASQYTMFRTVDQLFEEVRKALRSPGTLKSVAYDNARGYPTTVSLDPIKNAIDDELAYTTGNFAMLASSLHNGGA